MPPVIKSLSRAIGFATLALGISTAVLWVSDGFAQEEYRTFVNPDGTYRVTVLRSQSYLPTFPGQAGDAPGIVRLYNAEGEILREKDVPLVQLVDQVEWSNGSVRIKMIGEWPLAYASRVKE